MVTDISEIRILDFQVSYCVKLELNRKLKII